MDSEDTEIGQPAAPPQRRAHPRFPVDEHSHLIFLAHGLPLACRIVDLSLEGCRVRTLERFSVAAGLRIEIAFKANGMAFRFSGTTQWADGLHQLGIRFTGMTLRRKEELAEVIAELEEAAAREAERARQALVPVPPPAPTQPEPAALPLLPPRLPRPPQPPLPPSPRARRVPTGADRRERPRHQVDTSAVIFMIKGGVRFNGRILDLSLNGCRIRTDEPFPVGIYSRVEVLFHLNGLPFRIAGVIQAIHDRNQVGIRFLDMSTRNRMQVEELIEEIAQAAENLL